jgi:hypothetical protein
MGNRNNGGPYRGSESIHPFEEACCWPECHAEIGAVDGPLCERHLTKAFRIYRLSYLFALEHRPSYLLTEPYERRTGRPYPLPVRETPGLVYFVRFRDRVKIGFTTNLAQRMVDIPHDEILGTVAGTMEDEKRCHIAFAHLREQGEWFRIEPDLLAFITDVTSKAA